MIVDTSAIVALVLKEPRTASVITAEDTELLRFNDRTLRRIRSGSQAGDNLSSAGDQE